MKNRGNRPSGAWRRRTGSAAMSGPTSSGMSRRRFLGTTAAGLGAAALGASGLSYAQTPPNTNIVSDGMGGWIVYPVGELDLTETHPIINPPFSGAPCTQDVFNVQWAVLNADPGATLHLKSHKKTDNPSILTAFEFGMVDATKFGTLGMATLYRHEVTIETPSTVKGDGLDPNGIPYTKILHGWVPLAVGQYDPPQGQVTLEGIHFEDSGTAAIALRKTDYKVTIKDNRVTNDLYEYLGEVFPGGLKAWQRLLFNSAVGQWVHVGLMIGSIYAPEQCTGEVDLIGNYVDTEVGILPTGPTNTWYLSFGMQVSTATGNILVLQNTFKNASARGMAILDAAGTVTAQLNNVELGPLESTWGPIQPPTIGIAAVSGFYSGGTRGNINILENTIYCGAGEKTGIWAGGIELPGIGPGYLSSLSIADNHITLVDDYAGIRIGNNDDATIKANIMDGNTQYGCMIEGDSQNNWFNGNNLTHLNVPYPLDGALYYFGPGACNNTVKGYTGGSNTMLIDENDPDCNDVSGVK